MWAPGIGQASGSGSLRSGGVSLTPLCLPAPPTRCDPSDSYALLADVGGRRLRRPPGQRYRRDTRHRPGPGDARWAPYLVELLRERAWGCTALASLYLFREENMVSARGRCGIDGAGCRLGPYCHRITCLRRNCWRGGGAVFRRPVVFCYFVFFLSLSLSLARSLFFFPLPFPPHFFFLVLFLFSFPFLFSVTSSFPIKVPLFFSLPIAFLAVTLLSSYLFLLFLLCFVFFFSFFFAWPSMWQFPLHAFLS